MPHRTPPWLEPTPPWHAPASSALCAASGVAPEAVPVVELLSAPSALLEVLALRCARYAPLFAEGPRRHEAVRLLAIACRALGPDADPRGADHALTMTMHPQLGVLPLQLVAAGARDGAADPRWAHALLAFPALLGAGDALREQVARELVEVPGLELEAALAVAVGGGDYSTYREHYAALAHGPQHREPAVRAARAWFDWVLARRFAGLDALRALPTSGVALDGPTAFLVASGELVAGDEEARARMTDVAQQCLLALPDGPARLPRLFASVAREMAALVHHPLALRRAHLRCAAARDHGAMAVRAWLSAAVEPGDEADLLEEVEAEGGRALGPEPTRAGRAANEARAAAGDFLLDWFVGERDAREAVDAFARGVLRVYHRLRAATLLGPVFTALRPPGGQLTNHERVVYGALAATARVEGPGPTEPR